MNRKLVAAVAAVVLVASGGVLAQGKGNAKPAPLAPLAYYDANDVLVGRLAAPGDSVNSIDSTMAFPWGTEFLGVLVLSYDFGSGRETWFRAIGGLWYTEPNCAGTAYLRDAYWPGSFPVAGLANRWYATLYTSQGTILYVGAKAAPTQVVAQSVWFGNECGSTSQLEWSVPVEATLNLSQQFARPLTLK